MNTSQTLGQRITRNTFFLKRVLPALIFGTLTLAIFMPLAFGARHPAGFPYPVLVGPLVMIVIFYIVFRRLIFDLADEVTDEGDALRVRFGQEEERIPFEQIMNVSYTGMMNPPRITLMLRSPRALRTRDCLLTTTKIHPAAQQQQSARERTHREGGCGAAALNTSVPKTFSSGSLPRSPAAPGRKSTLPWRAARSGCRAP